MHVGMCIYECAYVHVCICTVLMNCTSKPEYSCVVLKGMNTYFRLAMEVQTDDI